jgi:hypothetical protein
MTVPLDGARGQVEGVPGDGAGLTYPEPSREHEVRQVDQIPLDGGFSGMDPLPKLLRLLQAQRASR